MAKGLLFQSLLKSTDLLACDGGRANIVFGLVFPKLHERNITRLEYELLYIQGKKPQLDYQAYQYNIITWTSNQPLFVRHDTLWASIAWQFMKTAIEQNSPETQQLTLN